MGAAAVAAAVAAYFSISGRNKDENFYYRYHKPNIDVKKEVYNEPPLTEEDIKEIEEEIEKCK